MSVDQVLVDIESVISLITNDSQFKDVLKLKGKIQEVDSKAFPQSNNLKPVFSIVEDNSQNSTDEFVELPCTDLVVEQTGNKLNYLKSNINNISSNIRVPAKFGKFKTRGSDLSSLEKDEIVAMNKEGVRQAEIARRLGRSRQCISRFLADPECRQIIRKRTGRKPIFSYRTKRRIIREALSGNFSSSLIKSRLALTVGSTRTIRRVLKSCGHVRHAGGEKLSGLVSQYAQNRLQWAELHSSWNGNQSKWHSVIFSDEKRFNLDGPDGLRSYWHDLRKEPGLISQQLFNRGSVLAWAGFGFYGKTEVAFLEEIQSAKNYQQMLEIYLLPSGEQIGGSFWIYQHEPTATHVADSTLEWFLNNGVHVMEWPAQSPDINPMETLWCMVARSVYCNSRQFSSKDELKAAIVDAWHQIQPQTLQGLVDSMAAKVSKLIDTKGRFIE